MHVVEIFRRDARSPKPEQFYVTEVTASDVCFQVLGKAGERKFLSFEDTNFVRYLIATDTIREVRVRSDGADG